jgi:hypothetical protein
MDTKKKKGITIKVTRIIETRARRKDEVRVTIWTGTKWVSPSATPIDPCMAQYWGTEPVKWTAKIEFAPPGTVSEDTVLYRETLLPKMRAMGIIK